MTMWRDQVTPDRARSHLAQQACIECGHEPAFHANHTTRKCTKGQDPHVKYRSTSVLGRLGDLGCGPRSVAGHHKRPIPPQADWQSVWMGCMMHGRLILRVYRVRNAARLCTWPIRALATRLDKDRLKHVRRSGSLIGDLSMAWGRHAV